MSDIHIERRHALGIERARAVARKWMAHVEREHGLACTYTRDAAGAGCDVARFTRPGLDGSLRVTHDSLTLDMALGFMAQLFRPMIEDKAVRQIDQILADAADGDAAAS